MKTIHNETASIPRPMWYKGKRDNVRVGIAVSTFGALPTGFVRSLCAVIRTSMFNNVVIDFVIDETKPLDDSRNSTVRELMKCNPDYIFFMDSDMLFAPETLLELLKQDKDIITGVYCQKQPPHNPVLRMYDSETKHYESGWTYPIGRLFTVDACGAGCLLVKREVFQDLKKPYFKWDSESGLSEDIYFCRKAKKAGYDIWVHGGLNCGHFTDLHSITPVDFIKHYQALEQMKKENPDNPSLPNRVTKACDYKDEDLK